MRSLLEQQIFDLVLFHGREGSSPVKWVKVPIVVERRYQLHAYPPADAPIPPIASDEIVLPLWEGAATGRETRAENALSVFHLGAGSGESPGAFRSKCNRAPGC